MLKQSQATLAESETDALIRELGRRSLGCLIVVMRAGEIKDGCADLWNYEMKGSPVLLGAMSAALSLRINQMLFEKPESQA